MKIRKNKKTEFKGEEEKFRKVKNNPFLKRRAIVHSQKAERSGRKAKSRHISRVENPAANVSDVRMGFDVHRAPREKALKAAESISKRAVGIFIDSEKWSRRDRRK